MQDPVGMAESKALEQLEQIALTMERDRIMFLYHLQSSTKAFTILDYKCVLNKHLLID